MTQDDTPSDPGEQLGWRIPIDEDDGTFRRGVIRVLLASVICLCLLLLFGSDQLRGYGLAAVGAGAVLTLAWLYVRRPRRPVEEENVWLSAAGLRWINEHGGEGVLPRESMQAFFLGLDPDAMRGLPALSFVLTSGLESQPIPLTAPATPERVREFLGSVLDFLAMDDAWVVQFCDAAGLPYDRVMLARAALPGGAQVHWT